MTWTQFGTPFKTVMSSIFVRFTASGHQRIRNMFSPPFYPILALSCIVELFLSIVRTCLPDSLLSSRICFGHLRPYSLIYISLYLFVVIFAFYTHTTTQLIAGIIHTYLPCASSRTVKTIH